MGTVFYLHSYSKQQKAPDKLLAAWVGAISGSTASLSCIIGKIQRTLKKVKGLSGAKRIAFLNTAFVINSDTVLTPLSPPTKLFSGHTQGQDEEAASIDT